MNIEIVKGNSAITVCPWVNTLEKELTCKRRITEIQKGGKLKFSFESIPLYFKQDNTGCGLTYPGLYSRTIAFLKKEGHTLTVQDLCTPIPEPDLTRITGTLREGQDVVLATIFASRRGVIVSPTAFGKTFIIEQLCRAYPSAHILVVARKKEVLSSIHKRIQETCPESNICIVNAGNKPKDDAKVIVCSAKSLHKLNADWPDILFFDEVHGAAAPEISRALTGFANCRIFGFTASPKGRSDKAELLIEALFGPQICNIDYASAQGNNVVAPIHVQLVHVKAAEIEKSFPVARERHNIWRNSTRNMCIARQAELYKEEQVLILVNTVEHGLFLKKFLPDYIMAHAGISKEDAEWFKKQKLMTDEDPLKVDTDKLRDDFKAGRARHVIATSVWREGVDFPELRVLIRADGSAGAIPAIQIGGRLARIADGKEFGLLIDFVDDFGKGYLGRSMQRIKHYQKQGWQITYPEDAI
jgi:superfamily II DNA or RNA helicase